MYPEIQSEGPNQTTIFLPGVTLFYSYETIIGYSTPETGRVLTENIYSQTTGKHINHLDPHKKYPRQPRPVFETQLSYILQGSTKMNINDMFPRKYAAGEDLAGKPVTLVINRIEAEQMRPNPAAPLVDKWVCYFHRAVKGVILSRTLANQIAAIHGPDTTTWPGKKVQLYPEPMTVAGIQRVAIRARPAPNGESEPPAGLQDDDPDTV